MIIIYEIAKKNEPICFSSGLDPLSVTAPSQDLKMHAFTVLSWSSFIEEKALKR